MTRRRTIIDRDNLVTRWARITGTTFPHAWDMTTGIDDHVLAETIATAERMIRDVEDERGVDHGTYLDWVGGQTTEANGVTR